MLFPRQQPSADLTNASDGTSGLWLESGGESRWPECGNFEITMNRIANRGRWRRVLNRNEMAESGVTTPGSRLTIRRAESGE